MTGRLVVTTGLPGSGKTTLATELERALPAIRMCPDDWMAALGIDIWDSVARDRIEQLQLAQALVLLQHDVNVVIEWGVWTRTERDRLRDSARSVGACVELRHLTSSPDELWRRIAERDAEGRFGSRAVTRAELDQWISVFETPTPSELATYDGPSQSG